MFSNGKFDCEYNICEYLLGSSFGHIHSKKGEKLLFDNLKTVDLAAFSDSLNESLIEQNSKGKNM